MSELMWQQLKVERALNEVAAAKELEVKGQKVVFFSDSAECAIVLAAEVRRLRAVYERIAEIPPVGLRCGQPVVQRDHVLRAVDAGTSLPWMEEYATLRDERDRLRAAVERVKALPRYGYNKVGQVHVVDEEDRWLNRDEVLAALEDMES